jgi:hypothetical protein
MGLRIVAEPFGITAYYHNDFVVAHTWITDRGDHFWETLTTERERGHCPTDIEAHSQIAARLAPIGTVRIDPLWRGVCWAILMNCAIVCLGLAAYWCVR